MRKTKFRAWDKQRKQMLFDGDYWSGENRQKDNSSICYPILVTNHGVQWCKKYPHPMPEGAIEFDRMTMEDLELMEFTGLKDKNGVEICEGDILARVGDTPYCGRHFVVKWQHTIRGCGFNLSGGNEQMKSLSVIGNIYENPELLEAKS